MNLDTDFTRLWREMTQEERDRVRAKASWEAMTLRGVLEQWPSLIPERFTVQVSDA